MLAFAHGDCFAFTQAARLLRDVPEKAEDCPCVAL